MPGSLTTPGCPSTRVGVLDHIAFRYLYSVGTQDIPIAAQWLACALPCRRFIAGLAASDARLGADAVRCSFIERTFTDYSLPVSRRTEIRTPDPQIRSLVLYPIDCFRLRISHIERTPWKD
jgi:hypothetical protein